MTNIRYALHIEHSNLKLTIRMLQPAPRMPLTATQVWLMMTLGVERLAPAFMQVLDTVIMGWYVFHHADIRWSGEQDLSNNQKLASLTERYLKIREEQIRNIAFNANSTDGGENNENSFL